MDDLPIQLVATQKSNNELTHTYEAQVRCGCFINIGVASLCILIYCVVKNVKLF